MVAETVWGRHEQFGNDDTSSKVWVAVRALVVGFPACPMSSLVLHYVAVEPELRWSVSVRRR
jgi:molybdopterin biosynthesis enzyme